MIPAMVTVDTRDVTKLAAWWAEALGGVVADSQGEFWAMVTVPDSPVAMGFQLVETPTPGKNRIHVDFSSTDRDAEVARLVAAGATHVEDHDMGGGMAWAVLEDPDGNQFCVAAQD